jgi:hypothetical protein
MGDHAAQQGQLMFPIVPAWRSLFTVWLVSSSIGLAAAEFRLSTRPVAIPERGKVTGYVLHSSGWRFSFLPPPNWAIKENPATETVVMMARDLTSSITLRHVTQIGETNAPVAPAQYRTDVLAAYPGAKITAEFACHTGDREGWACDLEQSNSARSKTAMRLAFVPAGKGRLEFKLTTPREKFSRHIFGFDNLLTTFRTESIPREDNPPRDNLL